MRISQKMILIFSVMMIAAVAIFSNYSIRTNLEGSSAFNASRFYNMGSAMSQAVERQVALMDLTLEELMDNSSFMAALNQLVRDDSADSKMANAARNMLQQQLYRSPMVDIFYRVTFYDREGNIVTSRFQKDDSLESGSNEAREVINALPWLDQVDAAPNQRRILPLHRDFLSTHRDTQVYGAVRAVFFHERQLGYIEISSEMRELAEILDRVDDETIVTQAVFDDGTVLYNRATDGHIYPLDMEQNVIVDYLDEAAGIHHSVMRIRNEWLGLNLFLSQDDSVIAARNGSIRWGSIRAGLYIAVPTLLLVIFVSLRLTRSIRQLTRKVRQVPVDHVLDSETVAALNQTVTSAQDGELRELEQVFNNTMLRLHESTMNELTLREGTLQAQLSALQTQINPHFIYNTLNIISAKSMESGNLDVIEICDQFAQLLRYSTDTRSKTATMAEEIENVRNYLLLAKARYEDNLEFTINIPENLSSISVPKLTLQPLVENAMTHGFDGRNVKRCLYIDGQVEKGKLILEIRDNGIGFSPEMLEKLQGQLRQIEAGQLTVEEVGGHIGLANTCLRLYYYSHGAMHVSIRNEGGAVVRLTMPC